MKFHQATLPNGLQIVAELSQSVHSVGLGFFVRTGARDETADVSGVSHFLEHMAFKGNETYSADDVNRIFDEIGARYNASTSEEVTLFHAAVLPEYVPTTMDLLTALLRPSLRDNDFDMEKKVIIEEIGMYDDLPGFIAYDKAMQTHFHDHPLGQSILGSVQSITDLTSGQMRAYHQSHYLAGNIVLAVAGKYEWEPLLELVTKHCSDWPAGTVSRSLPEPHPQPAFKVIRRESSLQEHAMLVSPACSGRHPLRFAAEILSVIVGDDSGSRLYWDLVEPG
ncbi:MAG: pitrilysin family protein, partial [Planctomycetales bacterium]